MLKVQHNKLEQATYRLRERDKALFQTCIGALKNKCKERAAICANEIAEVRKLIQFMYNVQLAIERVILRLETVKELGDVVFDLKPALKILQGVSQELLQVLPDVSSELSKVNETISETLHSTRITADESMIPVNRKTPGGEEIMHEVTDFLEQKISEKLPEPPTAADVPQAETALKEMVALAVNCSQSVSGETERSGLDASQTLFSYKKSEIKEISLKVEKPALEDALLEYVRKCKGEIDLQRCSVDLDTSNEEIEKALESLGAKGRIKIEVKTEN
ncbi:MAG: Snf7 family protein [Candidatus Bathyarchaeota archaeon]|nr:Snf7 family protein [Candidatus Bathyarchaeota archaeon]